MQMPASSKPKRNVKVSGISFQPDVWARLEEEVERQGHRNRSLVVEKALNAYFQAQDRQRKGEIVVVLTEGVA